MFRPTEHYFHVFQLNLKLDCTFFKQFNADIFQELRFPLISVSGKCFEALISTQAR